MFWNSLKEKPSTVSMVNYIQALTSRKIVKKQTMYIFMCQC